MNDSTTTTTTSLSIQVHNARDLMFTPLQQQVLFWIGKPTAVLGIVSSAYIAACILRDRPGWNQKVFRRLFFGLAICHIFMILLSLLSTLPTPEGLFYGSLGTHASCSAVAFWVHLAFVSTMVYNGAVGIYYYIVFQFNWSDTTIKRRVEPYLHGFAILYPVVGAVVGVSTRMYGPDPMFLSCWVGPDVPHRSWFIWGTGLFEMNIAIWIKFATVAKICYEVFQLERKSRNRMSKSMTLSSSISQTNHNSNARPQQQPPNSSVAREVFSQISIFLASCLVPYGNSMLLKFVNLYWVNNLPQDGLMPIWLFVMALLNQILFPLQGFINVFIFCRPLYLKRRRNKKHAHQSSWECWKASLWLSLGLSPPLKACKTTQAPTTTAPAANTKQTKTTTKATSCHAHHNNNTQDCTASAAAAAAGASRSVAFAPTPPTCSPNPSNPSDTNNLQQASTGVDYCRRTREDIGAGLPSTFEGLEENDDSDAEDNVDPTAGTTEEAQEPSPSWQLDGFDDEEDNDPTTNLGVSPGLQQKMETQEDYYETVVEV